MCPSPGMLGGMLAFCCAHAATGTNLVQPARSKRRRVPACACQTLPLTSARRRADVGRVFPPRLHGATSVAMGQETYTLSVPLLFVIPPRFKEQPWLRPERYSQVSSAIHDFACQRRAEGRAHQRRDQEGTSRDLELTSDRAETPPCSRRRPRAVLNASPRSLAFRVECHERKTVNPDRSVNRRHRL